MPAEERVACAYRAADILRKRRFELDAWLCYEIGKTWPEADADIAELIDFCEYYGRGVASGGAAEVDATARREKLHEVHPAGRGCNHSAMEFRGGHHGRHDARGHRHRQHGGGKTVERFAYNRRDLHRHSVRIGRAARRGQLLHRPRGNGGRSAVNHPKTRSSRSPARRKRACASANKPRASSQGRCGSSAPCSRWGGKDAIVVDEEADLDAAVEGVAVSAFGYQGQKCSACSRAIVCKNLRQVPEKLVEHVRKIKVGPIEDPQRRKMAPVIKPKPR